MVARAGSMVTLLDSSLPIPQVLSRDGQSWAGNQTLTGQPGGRYRNGTVTTFEYPPDAYVFEPTGISDDGSVVAIDMFPDYVSDIAAYRWENGVFEPLLGSADTFSYLGGGNTMTADGSIIVGTFGAQESHPGYWQGGDSTYLPIPEGAWSGRASAISADGTTIVGDIFMPDGSHPAVWRNGVVSLLPDLPTDAFVVAPSAINVSSDGSVIVGLVDSGSAKYVARWINDELELLGRPIPDYYPLTFDVTDDGSIVSFSTGTSMIWRDGLGRKPFDVYVERHYGLSLQDVLPNYTGLGVLEMTPDGRYFSGIIYDEFFNPNSFIAYLDPSEFVVPEPSAVTLAGCAAVALLWAHRRSRTPRS
jgi:hypothetical protein